MISEQLPKKEDWQDIIENSYADGYLKLVVMRSLVFRINDLLEPAFNDERGSRRELHELLSAAIDTLPEAEGKFEKVYEVGVQAEIERRRLAGG